MRDRTEWARTRLSPKLRRWYESAVVPADPPEGYASMALGELVGSLRTSDAGTAKAILVEAEAALAEPYDRIDNAERRATTLQGTVAIAASAVIAGGGLVLDGTRIQGDWRLWFVALLALVVGALLACAIRAVGVTGRMFEFEDVGLERIDQRASKSEADALTFRAAELLRAADVADVIASVKVGLLRAAAAWFRAALVLLAVLAASLCAYVTVGSEDQGDEADRPSNVYIRFSAPPSRHQSAEHGKGGSSAPSKAKHGGQDRKRD